MFRLDRTPSADAINALTGSNPEDVSRHQAGLHLAKTRNDAGKWLASVVLEINR
jgi:hypothetical protein